MKVFGLLFRAAVAAEARSHSAQGPPLSFRINSVYRETVTRTSGNAEVITRGPDEGE